MASRKRFILIGAVVLLLFIVVALVSIPRFLHPDRFRAGIESSLSGALGRKVTLGKLDFSLWSGSLLAQNVVVADDPAFSEQPFLRVSLVKIRVEVIPLIFSRDVHIEGFALVAPQLTLLCAENGAWNYSSIGHASVKTQGTQAQGGSMIAGLNAGHVEVSGGTLVMGSVPGAGAGSTRNRVYSGLNLDAKKLSFTKSFPFSASAGLPDAGRLSIKGSMGPINPEDASLTPFTAHAEIKRLDLAGVGMARSRVTGLIDSVSIDAAWSGRLLHVAKLLIDSPNLVIVRAATPSPAAADAQESNGATALGSNKAVAPESNRLIDTLSVDSLEVKNGVITVAASGQPVSRAVYRQVSLAVSNYSPNTSSPFNLSARLPGGGSLNSSGSAGPFNRQNAAATPIDAEISLGHADIAASGLLAPGSGIGGLLNLDVRATSDGRRLNANGVAHVEGLRLAKSGASSPQPVDVRFAGNQDMRSHSGQIQHSTVTMGSAVINVAGSFQRSGAATQASLKVDAPSIPIDQIQAILPSLGIKLPSGSHLQGGRLTASLSVTGPIGNPVISGPLRLDDTQLTGFDLGSELSSLAPLSGPHPVSGTVIRSLSLNLYATSGSIRTDNVILDVPALGSATGSGTIAANGELDYRVNLKLAALSGGGIGAAGAGSAAGELMGMVTGGAGKMIGALPANAFSTGIPLAIGGTISDPTFKPNPAREE
jgi:AsmA protein